MAAAEDTARRPKPKGPTRRTFALGAAALPAVAMAPSAVAAAAPSEIEALFREIEEINEVVEAAPHHMGDDWFYARAYEVAGRVDRMLEIRPQTLREFVMQAVSTLDDDPSCPNTSAFFGQVRNILGRA
ncbi:hypothetical protein [Albimonas pacifica]|uniref:TIGR02301 family protein n=1 Tax=Albimonas pacifica TaxID=1114924 RepID=A0A1I3LIK6_9RHOB|nr:hypothetical protein [Albimonas pacifica]SFI84599.1 hypothetical protein SAMN05216258_11048 [Albimonas pacifica]